MKKSIFIAVLGLAAGVASSYGQGYVVFSSYLADGGTGATTSIFGSNALVPAGYTASLYYFIGTVTDPVNEASAASITSPVTGLTLLGNITAAYAASGASTGVPGYFDGATAVIPGYTSGPITFEIVASNAAGTIFGRSGAFTESSIANSLGVPTGFFGDNGPGMPNFLVASPVPEPTTLALAGLGGLASLVAFRRKQA